MRAQPTHLEHDSTMATKTRSLELSIFEQLPIWPNELRGLPNALARSALFSVHNVRAGPRENYKRRKIHAVQGVTITYSGESLRQDDLDVFLNIVHMARMHELGTEVSFTGNSFLSSIGWSNSGAGYKRLIDCIDRLQASSISITVEAVGAGIRQNYTGSLIRSFIWRESISDTPMREWRILLEREIIALFSPSAYSRIDWNTRLKLSPMAKWLHAFYHTTENPIPFSVESLHKLMESRIAEMRHYRYNLKKALQLLVDCGFAKEARIDPYSDMVIVKRNIRPSIEE